MAARLSAQTIPYVRFFREFPQLRSQFDGVIQRNARNINKDPYANAFQASYHVWERKWEIDSLAWPVVLTWVYWRQTGDRRVFTWQLHSALRKIVATYSANAIIRDADSTTIRITSTAATGMQHRNDLGSAFGRPTTRCNTASIFRKTRWPSSRCAKSNILAREGYRDRAWPIEARPWRPASCAGF